MENDAFKKISFDDIGGKDSVDSKAEGGQKVDEKQAGNKKPDSAAPDKPRQSRKEDSYYAQLRREKEKAQKEAEDAKKALFETKSSMVSDETLEKLGLKREDLSDPDKLKLAGFYGEAEKEGSEDPAGYAYRKAYEERLDIDRKASDQAREAKERSEALGKKVADVFQSHGIGKDEALSMMKDDSDFAKRFGKYFTEDGGNIPTLLGIYLDQEDSLRKEARSRSNVRLPGDASSDSTPKKEDYAKMTPEQLDKSIREGMIESLKK